MFTHWNRIIHICFPVCEIWNWVLLGLITLKPINVIFLPMRYEVLQGVTLTSHHRSFLPTRTSIASRPRVHTYLRSHNTRFFWRGYFGVCGGVHLLTEPQTVLLPTMLRDSSFYRSINVCGLKYECIIFHIIFCAKYSKLDSVAVWCGNVYWILLYNLQSESVTDLRDETNY